LKKQTVTHTLGVFLSFFDINTTQHLPNSETKSKTGLGSVRERVQTHLVKMVARTPPKFKRTLAALNPVLIRETLNKVLIN